MENAEKLGSQSEKCIQAREQKIKDSMFQHGAEYLKHLSKGKDEVIVSFMPNLGTNDNTV